MLTFILSLKYYDTSSQSVFICVRIEKIPCIFVSVLHAKVVEAVSAGAKLLYKGNNWFSRRHNF